MYLNSLVKVPEARGKITFRTKGNTTYVEYESARVYVPEKKYTTVSRKTIGKLTDADRQVMQLPEILSGYSSSGGKRQSQKELRPPYRDMDRHQEDRE